MIKKINFILISLSFIYCAFLQINDPDPLLWFSIYFFPAIVSLSYTLGYTNFNFFYLGLLYFFYSIYIQTFNFETNVMHIFDEKTNESLGLIISGVWIIYFSLKQRKKWSRSHFSGFFNFKLLYKVTDVNSSSSYMQIKLIICWKEPPY